MDVLDEKFTGTTFTDPEMLEKIRRIIDGFVDDTTLWTNFFLRDLNQCQDDRRYSATDSVAMPHELITETTEAAQWWENMLWTTGGELELSKCFYYVMHWYFDQTGRPHLASKQMLKRLVCQIDIIQSKDNSKEKIKMKDSARHHKTLGVLPKPNGKMDEEAYRMKTKSKRISTNAKTSALTRYQGLTFYRQKWLIAIFVCRT